jgi:mannose-6-phosphate isomerase-like protein (cupin superfamily)
MLYPLHGHNAHEVYSVVSGAMTVTHGLDHPVTMPVEASGHSVTPAGEAHALNVGPDPALLIYCWTGDLFAPVWWWERAPDGSWSRTFPAMA